jgi:hypothetical protein
MAWVLFVAFWVWYAASGVVFLRGPGGFDSIWPLSLSLIWWLVLLFRAELQAWGRAVPLPIWLKFLIVGLFFSDVVMGNLAVSFKGDLHPNLALSSFLWLGAYGGVVLAWWLLAHLYPFTPWQVFFIYGFKGVIIEQDFMLPTMLWKGDWFFSPGCSTLPGSGLWLGSCAHVRNTAEGIAQAWAQGGLDGDWAVDCGDNGWFLCWRVCLVSAGGGPFWIEDPWRRIDLSRKGEIARSEV